MYQSYFYQIKNRIAIFKQFKQFIISNCVIYKKASKT